MKRSDLEKLQGKKITGRMKREPVPERFAGGAAEVHTRREQRERDQAAGLVPFAVKLPAPLVAGLQARAKAQGSSLNEVVAALLHEAMREEKP
jgi:hypothetical protein